MSIVDDGDQHLAAAIEVEGLLDQFAFALERGTLELDSERFAMNLKGVGISVQRSCNCGDQMLFLRQLLECFFDYTVARPRDAVAL